MGNNSNSKNNSYFTSINEEDIAHLRNNYKIIYVDYLDTSLVYYKMFCDNELLH
jgi:hypothetical protein